MASNPKLPVSENWRWPGDAAAARDGLLRLGQPREAMPGEVCIGHINGLRCSHPVGHDGPCAFRDPAAAQLRRDRDELAEKLEEEHAASADEHAAVIDDAHRSVCEVCRLLARVKGR